MASDNTETEHLTERELIEIILKTLRTHHQVIANLRTAIASMAIPSVAAQTRYFEMRLQQLPDDGPHHH